MPRTAQDGLAILFAAPQFDGFGPSRFHPDGESLGGHSLQGKCTILKRGVKEHAPRRPGVYAMLDLRGRIIYVGKAKCLRSRLSCYFREASRDPKAGRIIKQTRTLLWEYAADELAALLRELELIQKHRPRFNVIGVQGLRRYCYIALGRPNAPYAYVTREPCKKDLCTYGPFVGRRHAEAAVRRLNDAFQLRDCSATFPMNFADQQPLFESEKSAGCLRFELDTCLGPCGGGCTRRRYQAATRKAQNFLDGTDRSLLAQLKKTMLEASMALQYERACNLRDKLADLEWLDLRLSLLRRSRHESALVYTVLSDSGREVWYLLNRGRVWGVSWGPTSPGEESALHRSIARMLAEPEAAPLSFRTVDSVLLVAAWFRRYAGEKANLEAAATVLARLHPPPELQRKSKRISC